MATNHSITETATWDSAAPIAPNADAFMDDSTEIITALAQKFGNRTQYLYAQRGYQAGLIASNTAAINGVTSNVNALFSNAVVKNPLGSSQTIQKVVRVVGNLSTDADLGASGNANIAGQCVVGGNVVSQGNLVASSGNLGVNKFSVIDGAATFTGTEFKISSGVVELDSSVRILYIGSPGARLRQVGIPMCSGLVTQGAPQLLGNGQYWQGSAAGASTVMFPLRLPNACTLANVAVMALAPDAGHATSAQLCLTAIDWSQSTLTASDYAVPSVLGNASSTVYSSTVANRFFCAAGSHVVNNSFESLWVSITFGATTNNRLYGLQMQFIDAEITNG